MPRGFSYYFKLILLSLLPPVLLYIPAFSLYDQSDDTYNTAKIEFLLSVICLLPVYLLMLHFYLARKNNSTEFISNGIIMLVIFMGSASVFMHLYVQSFHWLNAGVLPATICRIIGIGVLAVGTTLGHIRVSRLKQF